MLTTLRRAALAALIAAIAVLGLPGVAQATTCTSYACDTANAPTTPGSCGDGTNNCVKVSATIKTASSGTLPSSITVTFTLCKGSSTSSCTSIYAWPSIVMYPSPYTHSTTYTVTAVVKCKSIGTAYFFTKAVMSNTTASGTVVDYSAPKSQSGCTSA